MTSFSICVAICLIIGVACVNNANACQCSAQEKLVCQRGARPGEEVDCYRDPCYQLCIYVQQDGSIRGTVYSIQNGTPCKTDAGANGYCRNNRCIASSGK